MELSKLLEFCLFRVLVERREEFFVDDEVLIAFSIVDFHVSEIGVDAETKVGGKGPWGSCPGEKRSFGVVNQGECNGD